MIYVCDAIMGTGKSSAAIAYMNEHPEDKFIYIAPFLDEAARISSCCSSLQFCEPAKKTEHRGSKIAHTFELIKEGKNVATTHQAFRNYPCELLESVKNQKYTLIIDESVDVLESVDENVADVDLLIKCGCMGVSDNGECYLINDDYSGEMYRRFLNRLKTNGLVRVINNKKTSFYHWILPEGLIDSFEDVYVLTYLFEGSTLHAFLKMYNFHYKKIGISRSDEGYRFSEDDFYVPGYVQTLKSKIHINDDFDKLSYIGDGYYDLSMNWFTNNPEGVKELKRNIYNFFFNKCNIEPDRKMWCTYKNSKEKLKGKGYTKGFVNFNEKATNKYRHKKALAYCVNVFMNVEQKLFFQMRGIEINEELYALSSMVQWVWRSAIRDGEEIFLYIPSRRMRELFKSWIEIVSSDGDMSNLQPVRREGYLFS